MTRIRRCLFCKARVFYEDGGVCPSCKDKTPTVVDVELPAPAIAVEPKPRSIDFDPRCTVCGRPSRWDICDRCEDDGYLPRLDREAW